MEIKRVNLDRGFMSSSQIEKRQNFKEVLILSKLNKQPTWKSPWFYGAVGLSSFAVSAISLVDLPKPNLNYGETVHLKEKNINNSDIEKNSDSENNSEIKDSQS